MSQTLPLLADADLALEQPSSRASTHPGEAEPEAGFGALTSARGPLPLVALAVHARLDGLLATTEVSQTFVNPFAEALEATYIFPLPDRAAVTRFRLEVAGRVVEGELKERGQARREYRAALRTGHRAAITEEDRPGVFSLRVGNLPPGERAVVRLTLVGPLPYRDGEATFRFPLVVAPRYIPGTPLEGAQAGLGTQADTDAVPDASRISPPVLLPGFPNPVRLSLSVDVFPSGLAPVDFRSSLHAVSEENALGVRRILVQPGERLDRDFVLRFRLAEPVLRSALLLHPDAEGEEGTFALTLVPPLLELPPRPRDVVFVLDRSGSMGGWKMVAARRAVARMAETLLPHDRFQIFAFDYSIESLSGGHLLDATQRWRTQAVEFVRGIEARGGTEMAAPLERAVQELLRDDDTSRDRVLVLITDGQVGNEDQILQHLGKRLKQVRVFALGIDQAVNAGFLHRLAEQGGGSCELVESEARLDEVMTSIHRRLGQPVLSALELRSVGLEVLPGALVPERLPDVFPGTPVQILGRYRGSPTGGVQLTARAADGSAWSCEVAPQASDSPALAHVWGRGQVRALEDRYAIGAADKHTLERRIIATSLRFGVLCRFTAYVAVDRTEVVNAGGEVKQVVQPVETPAGWDAPEGSSMPRAKRRRGAPSPVIRAVPQPSALASGARPQPSALASGARRLEMPASPPTAPQARGKSVEREFAASSDDEQGGRGRSRDAEDESQAQGRNARRRAARRSQDELRRQLRASLAEEQTEGALDAVADRAADFVDLLLRDQVISPEQLADARALETSTGSTLEDSLLKFGYATNEQIMNALAEQHGVPYVDLTGVTIPPAVVELMPESVVRENVVLPIAQEGGTLKVLMSDPSDLDTLQKLQFILNTDIQPVLSSREQIVEAIDRHYGASETESVDSMLAEFTDTAIDFTETEATQIYDGPPTDGRILDVAGMPREMLREEFVESDCDAPVIKLVNLILQEAVSLRASDIHIEPFVDRVCVRYRINGVLVERDNPPLRLLEPILARLKIMASLDIAEKRRPQEGRIKMNINGRHYDMRLSIMATVHGQSAVIHISDPAQQNEGEAMSDASTGNDPQPEGLFTRLKDFFGRTPCVQQPQADAQRRAVPVDLKPFAPRALAMLESLANVPGYSPGMYQLILPGLAPQLTALVTELLDAGARQPEVERLARLAVDLAPFVRGDVVDDVTAAHLFEAARVALADFVGLADPTLAMPPMLERADFWK